MVVDAKALSQLNEDAAWRAQTEADRLFWTGPIVNL
jgi:hypothetical protein